MFSQRLFEISNNAGGNEDGAVLMEYALLFILLVVVAITAMAAFGVSVLDLYTSNAERFDAAVLPTVGQ